jgi:hypothetical protein
MFSKINTHCLTLGIAFIFLQIFPFVFSTFLFYCCIQNMQIALYLRNTIQIRSSFCVLNLLLPTCGPNFAIVAALHESLSRSALGCLVSKLTNVRQGIPLRIKGHLEIHCCIDAISWFCKSLY